MAEPTPIPSSTDAFVLVSIGELKKGQADLSAWVGKLDAHLDKSMGELRGEMAAGFGSSRTEMQNLRASVELIGTKMIAGTISVPKESSNGNGTGNGSNGDGDLTKDEKGFWLAVGRISKKIPKAVWVIVGAVFLIGLIVSAPTILRMIPGFKSATVSAEMGPPIPMHRNWPRATP